MRCWISGVFGESTPRTGAAEANASAVLGIGIAADPCVSLADSHVLYYIVFDFTGVATIEKLASV